MKIKGEVLELTHKCLDRGFSTAQITGILCGRGFTEGFRYMEVRKEVIKELDRYTKMKVEEKKRREEEKKVKEWIIRMLIEG